MWSIKVYLTLFETTVLVVVDDDVVSVSVVVLKANIEFLCWLGCGDHIYPCWVILTCTLQVNIVNKTPRSMSGFNVKVQWFKSRFI